MGLYKCKISVFCGFLLLCFSAGTICGVLCFRILFRSCGYWVAGYYARFSQSGLSAFLQLFFSRLRPFLIVTLVSVWSARSRFILVLAFLRGSSISYLLCTAFCAGCPVFAAAFSYLIFLSAYLWLCVRLFFIDQVPITQCAAFSVLFSALSAFVLYCTL